MKSHSIFKRRKKLLIAVRAKVESVEHWRERFKTHVDLFKSQGVSAAHMGAANEERQWLRFLKQTIPMNL